MTNDWAEQVAQRLRALDKESMKQLNDAVKRVKM